MQNSARFDLAPASSRRIVMQRGAWRGAKLPRLTRGVEPLSRLSSVSRDIGQSLALLTSISGKEHGATAVGGEVQRAGL